MKKKTQILTLTSSTSYPRERDAHRDGDSGPAPGAPASGETRDETSPGHPLDALLRWWGVSTLPPGAGGGAWGEFSGKLRQEIQEAHSSSLGNLYDTEKMFALSVRDILLASNPVGAMEAQIRCLRRFQEMMEFQGRIWKSLRQRSLGHLVSSLSAPPAGLEKDSPEPEGGQPRGTTARNGG